jgi:hypothetical protein
MRNEQARPANSLSSVPELIFSGNAIVITCGANRR